VLEVQVQIGWVDSSIAVIPKSVIDGCGTILDDYRASSIAPDFGVWVEGKQNEKANFL
jgi:hypothetical protein